MDESIKKLKQYLNKTRSDKKITVQSVADELKKSKSYISQIESVNENVSRDIPGNDFLYDYIGAVSDSTDEYKYHIDHINELTGWDLKAGVQQSYIESLFGDSSSSPQMHVSYDEAKKRLENKFYPFNISDINYHLTDKKNHAFYKDYKLTPEDKEAVNKMIHAHLSGSIESEKQLVLSLFDSGDIDEKQCREVIERLNKNLDDINK